jgi:hypothetical protein
LIVVLLLIPAVLSRYRGYYNLARVLVFFANGFITAAMIASLIFLIQELPKHLQGSQDLWRSAAALLTTNVLVFALWYWKLDAGGPTGRERTRGRLHSSFLFPQTLDRKEVSAWSPEFVDYLFLAFNTSTAFSPTDTAARARWAKNGMMRQSLISLSIIALLAARAVNILWSGSIPPPRFSFRAGLREWCWVQAAWAAEGTLGMVLTQSCRSCALQSNSSKISS